jgi:hypothetical protein
LFVSAPDLAALAAMRSLLVLLLLAGSGSATIYPSTISPSVEAVTGRVRAVRSEWQGRRIVSRVELEQDGVVREVLVPGGSLDGIAMRVAGAPRFTVGERARVTVRATPGGLRMVGLGTGKVVLP